MRSHLLHLPPRAMRTPWLAVAVVALALFPAQISAQSGGSRENTPAGGIFHSNTKSRSGFYYTGGTVVRRPNGRWGFDDYPVVVRVDSGSAAARAGLMVNDVLLNVNGRDTRDGGAAQRQPGETRLAIRIRRGEEEKELVIEVPPPQP